MPGTLSIVATPIGNLEDITLRALRILKEVDLIACEDTRRTLKLLNHFGIKKRLISYFEHNELGRLPEILSLLKAGQNVALVSDAGTPTISDPGFPLVREAVACGIRVEPIPGPCAAITALATSGLPTDRFLFIGFLPQKRGKRRSLLESLRDEEGTIILYESPHRILKALTDIASVLGNRPLVIVRELTKVHEEFVRGSADEISRSLQGAEIKGEFVVLVAGNQR